MGRPQDSPRSFLSIGNPFRMISPKGSSLSPKLVNLLNSFEDALGGRLKKLKPGGKEDILNLSWMRSSMELLCGIHTDIKTLITSLELPVSDWEDKWIDVYLDNSVKLLDICNAFSSEISRLNQGNLYLQCALHSLGSASHKRACTSLDGWKQHIDSKNPKLDNCFSIIDSLAQTLDLPKIKNSAKGKVLMRAMYGVKVVTLFICSTFSAALSGSAKKLMDLQVPETCLWAEAFADVQTFVNTEIRNIYSSHRVTVVKELEAVDMGVKKLNTMVQDEVNPIEAELLQKSVSDLEMSARKYTQGMDLLSKEVDSFFQILLTGRNALLSNLRIGGKIYNLIPSNNVEGQLVR